MYSRPRTRSVAREKSAVDEISAVKTWPKGRPTEALRSGAGRLALTLKGGALEMAAFCCNVAFTGAPSAALRFTI